MVVEAKKFALSAQAFFPGFLPTISLTYGFIFDGRLGSLIVTPSLEVLLLIEEQRLSLTRTEERPHLRP